ncbi:tetraacyldisaccharide 4'-kinase [Candidatus Endolissoclinum faulkneri]|uniref:tetraacyldisaccharide 4'-kinase n=1 Tax=Candidatus Endolissoclinum faulkneri TaxID=1263979 RepID=UPI001D04B4FD|nr:tetraacyldisaccharide 4'-kinase [Candidatus Endolissoclinum faulkneri]
MSPKFWQTAGWLALALLPISWLWRLVTCIRKAITKPYRSSLPLICVGNAIVGGAGKTPTVLAIASKLIAHGKRVGLLSRGYGGRHAGPIHVDLAVHTFADVGDESILLTARAPTVVARCLPDGARLLEDSGCDVIIMDDGLQNPSVIPTISLLVVDGVIGIGNGQVIPSGPLREPWKDSLQKSHAVLLIGEDRREIKSLIGDKRLVLLGMLEPSLAALSLRNCRVLAFAGIGRPYKFHETLIKIGAKVIGFRSFADHHPYRLSELNKLVEEAVFEDAILVTTAKDATRLPVEIRASVTVVEVSLVWGDPTALSIFLDRILSF